MGDGIKFNDTADARAIVSGRAVIDPGGQIGGPTHTTEFFASINNTGDNYVVYQPKTDEIVETGLVFGYSAGNYTSYRSDLLLDEIWDLANNGNDGTLTNGAAYNADADGSILFDGLDDYIEIGSIDSSNPLSLFNDTQATFEVWIKPQSTGDGYQRIIDKSTGGNATNGYVLSIGGATPDVKSITFQVNGVTGYNNSSPGYEFNQWNHIVITKNGTLHTYYLNGSSVTSLSVSTTFPSATANCRIGTWNSGGGREFKGSIGSISIYNTDIGSSGVLQNYNATRGRFGL